MAIRNWLYDLHDGDDYRWETCSKTAGVMSLVFDFVGHNEIYSIRNPMDKVKIPASKEEHPGIRLLSPDEVFSLIETLPLVKALPRNRLKDENTHHARTIYRRFRAAQVPSQRKATELGCIRAELRVWSLWNAAGPKRWNTRGGKRGGDATRRWRNHKIAEYLIVPYNSDQQRRSEINFVHLRA